MKRSRPMKGSWLAGLHLAWDCGNLPLDPFEPAMPLPLDDPVHEAHPALPGGDLTAADIVIRASLSPAPVPSPEREGTVSVLYHGETRCFLVDGSLHLWDGASILSIAPDGRGIEASVHPSSIERPFLFSSVTITMALLLALRYHDRFHLHAAAASLPDGENWVIVGDSGCGKSTLALALFHAGAYWASDDVLLLHPVGAEVEAMGWARRVRVTRKTAAAFPTLAPLFTPCPAESARDLEIDPRIAFPGRGRLSIRPPLILLFPRIGRQNASAALPLDRAEAFGRLMQACAWVASEHLPRRRAQIEALKNLIDHARAFEVTVGGNILGQPEAVVTEIKALLRSR